MGFQQLLIHRDFDHHARLQLSMPWKTSPDIERFLAAGMRIAFHMALANDLDGRIEIQ